MLSRCKDANAEKDLVPEIGSLAQVQLAMVRVSFEIFIHDSHQPDFIARQKQKRAKDRRKILQRKAYARKTNQAIKALIHNYFPYIFFDIDSLTHVFSDEPPSSNGNLLLKRNCKIGPKRCPFVPV